MEETVVNQDVSEPSNVPDAVVEEKVVAEAEPVKPAEPVVEEPTFELDGQRLTASQIKEMKDALENKDKWTKTNTQRAQEIAAERKRLARYELLDEQLQKNPAALQTLFQPPAPQRDLTAELQLLYQQKPQDIFSPEYQQWEMEKDQALYRKSVEEAKQSTRQEIFQQEAQEHNNSIGKRVEEKLRSKGLDETDIAAVGQFVVENFKPKNGKYDESHFDIAYSHLYADTAIRQAKLDTAKSVASAMTKATPAQVGQGINKKQEPKSSIDESDDAFVRNVNERAGH